MIENEIWTHWVKPPSLSNGLDHLGVQAPCISLYGRLLPRITNVTDRARYYSYYPWFIWSFDKRYPDSTESKFIDTFRKGECLLSLIAARHSNTSQNSDKVDHGTALVGNLTLVPVLEDMEKSNDEIHLSTYATRDTESENRYFKNKLGGLGQYYRGTLEGLKLIDTNKDGMPCFTQGHGEELAKKKDLKVNSDLFFKTIEADDVKLADLDALSSFCPCQLIHNEQEHDYLTSIFFGKEGFQFDDGFMQRKLSLLLILDFLNELDNAQGAPLNRNIFIASCYTKSLPNQSTWECPEVFDEIRRGWAVYQRNELLSLATQSLFFVALSFIQTKSDFIWANSNQIANKFAESNLVKSAVDFDIQIQFSEYENQIEANLPAINHFWEDKHELSLAEILHESFHKNVKNPRLTDMIGLSIRILVILSIRDHRHHDADPYDCFPFNKSYLKDYPINLSSFRNAYEKQWQNCTMKEFICWVIVWCIDSHLIIALGKLHHTSRDTFQLRPTDLGFKVINKPPPVYTNPRFKQAVQMLNDLGAIKKINDSTFNLSDEGKNILGAYVGN
jgi:hypothetical protein